MPITTTTDLPAPIQQSFNYKLLSVKVPSLIHGLPADMRTMTRNGGTTMRFRRPNKLNPALVPLGNTGVMPPSQQLSAVDIDAKLQNYGTWVQINEQVTIQNQDPALNEASMLLGISLRETEDQLTRDMLAGTAAAINCQNGLNGDVPTNLTSVDVQEISKRLLSSDAKTVLDNIEGSDKYGTAPVHDSFFGLCHTDLTKDMSFVPGFVHKNNYGSQTNILRSEWGNIGSLRFLVSSKGSYEANASFKGNNRYNIFCVGIESYAIVKQDGYSSKFIYHPPSLNDRMELNSSAAFKIMQVPRILNDEWVLNLRCTLFY